FSLLLAIRHSVQILRAAATAHGWTSTVIDRPTCCCAKSDPNGRPLILTPFLSTKGGSRATIVAPGSHFPRILPFFKAVLAYAAFWPHPSTKSLFVRRPRHSRRQWEVFPGPQEMAGETGSRWTPRPASRRGF